MGPQDVVRHGFWVAGGVAAGADWMAHAPMLQPVAPAAPEHPQLD